MSYGTDGPCTLAEAQEDDEDRVTITLTINAQPMIDALDALTARMSHRPGSQSDAQGSGAPVDVRPAARAGEAQDEPLAVTLARATLDRDAARQEADILRAKVARVEALAEEWTACDLGGLTGATLRLCGIDIREALADPAPVEQHDDEAGA